MGVVTKNLLGAPSGNSLWGPLALDGPDSTLTPAHLAGGNGTHIKLKILLEKLS